MIVLMVVNADQAEDGAVRQRRAEGAKSKGTVIVMCTCAPERVEAIAARVEETGRED